MKSLLTALFLCLLYLTPANAQYLKDDRYPNWDNRTTGKVVYKSVRHKRVAHKKHYVKKGYKQAPSFRAQRPAGLHFLADAADAFTTPVQRMAGAVIHGGKPSGAPRAWCGFWLGRHLGMLDRKLWLARNWAGVGRPTSPSAGSVVVWNHHVGVITAVQAGRIRVLSGNDGHRVRERWRSMAGVIAVRRI